MAQALGEDLVQPPELQDDSSSLGSDSELSGPGPYRQADRYGFIGGSSAEPGPGHPPADLIRQREMKWVEMTLHWEKTMSRRYKKVKMQCRKGIPSALRARCWPLLCGAHVCQKNSPGTYQELAEAPGDPQWMETIGRDLHRQFPLHEMFVSPQGHGRGSCRCSRPTPCIDRSRATARPRGPWLLCCSCTCPRRRPSGAWCRSVRSTSLATMGPTWRLCGWMPRCSWPCCGGCSRTCTSTCSRWASGPCSTCPSGSCASSPAPCPSPQCCVSGMPSSVREEDSPGCLWTPRPERPLSPGARLQSMKEGGLGAMKPEKWRLGARPRTGGESEQGQAGLPVSLGLRLDTAIGAKVLFRVGLTLVRLALGTAEQRGACPGLLETLGALRAIPPAQLQEEAFMSQVHNVVLSERDLQREIKAQLAQLPDSVPGPLPRPQVRLAGAQAIFEAQQLAGARRGAKPEVPRIVVQPPEEPRPPRRKPQTRGKTFHGLLTRARGPPIEGPPRPQRSSTSFLDTRF
ncbi:carabin isoform X2 [Rhinopithecus roxellana]|uniref:carabin isoform X2 n=2 Tax=Rhinopithecus roxellana TaxID=61622 RepID=UPI0012379A05|nr:carabin isoform X2 [Rhinopithecus roxellana]XP_030774079.1 carabin isoform X2 [Rhinopithecus roxellana]XP_030774080.1 carabin isoform X2 [Rhinopithecus roxellana]XP_030774081.1 carabin isoform X2 [Rhinopithecus roxellana]